jgi:hypothetical protein
MERRRCVWLWLLPCLFVFLTSAHSIAASLEPSTLIGTTTWNFNLASTNDRLINYGDEYYGKSYLIMTFFPAAFTPV